MSDPYVKIPITVSAGPESGLATTYHYDRASVAVDHAAEEVVEVEVVPLPTIRQAEDLVPGVYLDRDGDPVVVSTDGRVLQALRHHRSARHVTGAFLYFPLTTLHTYTAKEPSNG